MAKDVKYFTDPAFKESYLAARGFDANGARSGGLVAPKVVDLSTGTVIFRLWHDPKYEFGGWWFTPYEMSIVIDYFARSGPAFAVDRGHGKGILHATLAVRHDWGGSSPDHLGRFTVVRLDEPFKAFFGEGDHAPDKTQRQVQKAALVIDRSGKQRAARQLFLPKFWEFRNYYTKLPVADDASDTGLIAAVKTFARGPLYFET